jgi:hypothetical protein
VISIVYLKKYRPFLQYTVLVGIIDEIIILVVYRDMVHILFRKLAMTPLIRGQNISHTSTEVEVQLFLQ